MPSTSTTDDRTKPDPVTVNVVSGPPALTDVGAMEARIGSGDTIPTAPPSRMRGLVTLPAPRLSVTGRPVVANSVRMSSTVAAGLACFRTAHAPATCGVAIEVPLKVVNAPPGVDESMSVPGAKRSRSCDTFEKNATESISSTAPTLTAVEIQAGQEIALLQASLPDAATVAIPAAFRLSMTARNCGSSASQALSKAPAPRLKFTEAIGYWSRSS